jgi:hypothetical protein
MGKMSEPPGRREKTKITNELTVFRVFPFAIRDKSRRVNRPPPQLLEFLHRYPSRIQSLALAVRTFIHQELAPCHEYIFDMRSKTVLVYGATEHVIADGICNVGVYARHVTLGFPRGADLKDPGRILRGAGKGMRHIRIYKLSELERPEIRMLLRQARRLAGLTRRRDRSGDDVVTRVKPKVMRTFNPFGS